MAQGGKVTQALQSGAAEFRCSAMAQSYASERVCRKAWACLDAPAAQHARLPQHCWTLCEDPSCSTTRSYQGPLVTFARLQQKVSLHPPPCASSGPPRALHRHPSALHRFRCFASLAIMSYEAARRFKDPLLAPYVPANSDAEGYLEAEKPGLKHPAVRDSGRDSTWRPPVANVAPRQAGWARPTAGGA
ncbi:hypothetical protein ABPG75_006723 [Micractinium tetrahymenae]